MASSQCWYWRAKSPFSHPARIQTAAKHAPDAALFGAEPPADWCTFFEKGDLARQYQHWDEAIRIYQQAESSGFVARSGGEYLPFIEAYVRRLEFSKALDLSTQAAAITRNLGPLLCSNWARMGQSIQIPPTVLDQVRSSFACSW